MPTTCIFQLDRTNSTYNSGEYISGRIVLKTDKVKRVNAIYVTLEGEARVQWSSNNKNETANYFGHQQYLHTRANVLDSTDFRVGTHVYMLNLHIPPECPSSCKARYGYIAYTLSLTIDKPWSFDEKFHKPINVVQTLDLNLSPEYSLPIKDESIKYFCHWPCKSGPICSTLVLPFSGFVPAQQVPFFLEVDNQSPQYDIIGVEASLKQHFVFMSRKPLKRNYLSKTIAKRIITERTLRLTKRLYEYNVCLPEDLPRSTLNVNYIVFVHYTLKVKLKTGHFHYDTTIAVPFVVGTVPLRDPEILVTTQPTFYGGGVVNMNETESDNETDIAEFDRDELPDDKPPSFESCLPPSFSFAVFGKSQKATKNYINFQNQQINMPRFPDYNDYMMERAHVSTGSLLNLYSYNSYGSLGTDNSGRSLSTLETCFGPGSDDEFVCGENCRDH